ncbi:Rab3 GTPase-activating protein catalytic subunit [Sesamum angolense]|uniref:Rab3 GTPase-activating protein catalytic subunit n=1 Tax=Sesamum angolense TaxID=2727404 RepID=A0AAE2BIV8_9LAMI|nr:Rab3 GTPase-activating protein catalytic subunit [Sesamum angolense]
MLETGEPIYSPVMQEPPLLTEDLIKETEEFVLRTGRSLLACVGSLNNSKLSLLFAHCFYDIGFDIVLCVGAGCSQLLSDMQAFKVKSNMRHLLFVVKAFLAANPGCILEDFVRWHSPPDWMENDTSSDLENASDGGDVSTKGQLSTRMQKEGNLWRELWDTSKPVPAVRQAPLYDEDLAVEGILDALEEISPPELFKQLFIAVGNIWAEKLDDICQVYETVETMLLNQDEELKITGQPEETTGTSDMKNRLKKLSLIFSGKNKSSSKGKKPPKAAASPADKLSGSVENDWTIL